MKIQKIIPLNILEFSQMDALYFPYPWKESDWTEISKDSEEWWLWEARQQDKLMGFLLIRNDHWNDLYHLIKILVVPEARQHRVAGKLFDTFIEQTSSKTVLLEVATSNFAAISFYQKKNFTKLQEIKAYYSDGSNAFVMQRSS